MTRICRYCGSELDPNSRFCTKCGKPVDDIETAENTEETLDFLALRGLGEVSRRTIQEEMPEVPARQTAVPHHEEATKTEPLPAPEPEKKPRRKKEKDPEESSHPVLTSILSLVLVALIGAIVVFMVKPSVYDPILSIFNKAPVPAPTPETTPVTVVDEPEETPTPEVTAETEPEETPEATEEPEPTITPEPTPEATPEPTPSQSASSEKIGDIRVRISNLHIRKGPSTKYASVGAAQKNKSYPVYESKASGEYVWYRIGKNQWIADKNGQYAVFTPDVMDDD